MAQTIYTFSSTIGFYESRTLESGIQKLASEAIDRDDRIGAPYCDEVIYVNLDTGRERPLSARQLRVFNRELAYLFHDENDNATAWKKWADGERANQHVGR